MFGGMLVAVSEGTVNADSLWMLTTDDPITIGTTALTFARIKVLSADLLGTTTNDNAAAGVVGEYVESVVLIDSAISLTTGANANVTSISLSAGDWDVSGVIGIIPAATTSMTFLLGGISSTSATMPPDARGRFLDRRPAYVPGGQMMFPLPTTRFSLSSTTSIYLVAQEHFTVSTCGAFGAISARRVR
jgi:hypothetical protein